MASESTKLDLVPRHHNLHCMKGFNIVGVFFVDGKRMFHFIKNDLFAILHHYYRDSDKITMHASYA